MTPWIDGLLEGHETPGVRLLYRLWMICYIIFCVFAGLGNIGLVMHDGSHPSYPMVSLMILGLLFFSLFMVKSYKEDGLDPKFKRATGVLMLFITVLSVAAVMIFAETVNFKKEIVEEYGPSTPAPTPTPTGNHTPAPGDNTTSVSYELYEQHLRHMHEMERKGRTGFEAIHNPPRKESSGAGTGSFRQLRKTGERLQSASKHRFTVGRQQTHGDDGRTDNLVAWEDENELEQPPPPRRKSRRQHQQL